MTRNALNRVAIVLIHFIPAGMLALAIGHWPYSYYMLLRVIVLVAGLLLAGLIYQRTKQFSIWVGLFLVAALIFNPFVPLHLTRGVWSILNIATAALFVSHFSVEDLMKLSSKFSDI